MALTFALSGLRRNVAGDTREHVGLLTLTGTNTADGDTITAASLGLELIYDLQPSTPAVDSTSSPALGYQVRFIPAANQLSGKVTFWGTNAVPGAAVADPEVTAGTTLTNYSFRFRAIGR
jgi:hypothetical protein